MAVELLASDLTTVEHRQLELFLDAQSDATASAVLEDLIARFGECTFYQASVANTRALLAERRFELDALGAA